VKNDENRLKNYTQIWRDFGTIYKILYRGMDKKFSESGTNVLEYRILRILDGEQRKTMANLAEMTFVTQAWITGMIDKMEDKDLVKRVRSEEDRRVIYVEMTNNGTEFFNKMRKIHDNFLIEMLSFIETDDAKEMAKIANKFLSQLEKKCSSLDE
jgi:DNA-binding MarR family transcriptional regulator